MASKWTVEALLLSDDLAKLIAANSRGAEQIEATEPQKEDVMSQIPVTKSTGEIPDVEAGTYMATCVRVKDDTIENPQFGDGNVVRLYMVLNDVVDEQGDEVELDGMANRKITPKSKLTRWAEALGRPIDFDHEDNFDPEELVGCQCLIKVVRADKDSWPKIDDMTAPPKVGRPASAKPTEESDVSAWWATMRANGLERMEVMAKSEELFSRPPAELTSVERAELTKALSV